MLNGKTVSQAAVDASVQANWCVGGDDPFECSSAFVWSGSFYFYGSAAQFDIITSGSEYRFRYGATSGTTLVATAFGLAVGTSEVLIGEDGEMYGIETTETTLKMVDDGSTVIGTITFDPATGKFSGQSVTRVGDGDEHGLYTVSGKLLAADSSGNSVSISLSCGG